MLGAIGVCIVVLTGPVFCNQKRSDGTLRGWSKANKLAPAILLVLYAVGLTRLAPLLFGKFTAG